jgi:hypothetical protein
LIVTIDYEQSIAQVAAEDFPVSGLAGAPELAIHHEPGLFLNMTNQLAGGPDIARLATIPHGDAALALGRAKLLTEAPSTTIPTVNALPIGVDQSLDNFYLLPYKHFHEAPFQGKFDPIGPDSVA